MKIYCEDCKFHGKVVYIYHQCKANPINNFISPSYGYNDCWDYNRDNSCKQFKPNILKRIKMFFQKMNKELI